MIASLNGEIQPIENCRVSVLDRGYLFGDGVYEVFRLYGGKPFLVKDHMVRLKRSLDELGIVSNVVQIEKRMMDLIKQSGAKEGLVYLQITRGVYPARVHAYHDPSDPNAFKATPTEFMYVAPPKVIPPRMYEKGCSVVTFEDLRWKRCDIKSLNLLGNVMAAQYAKEKGALEAVLVTKDQKVIEGSLTSVFWVRKGVLETNPLTENLLPSVTRAEVVRIAKKIDVPMKEVGISLAEFLAADEVFLAGTTTEVLGVGSIDGMAKEAPGPVTKALHAALSKEIAAFVGE